MQNKDLSFELKELDTEGAGSFEGLLSVYNIVDLGNDSIEPGSFTKTIQEKGPKRPLLWQHKSDTPIGMITLIDGPDALRVRGATAPAVTRGAKKSICCSVRESSKGSLSATKRLKVLLKTVFDI